MTSSSVHNSPLKFRLFILSLFVAAPSITVAAPHPDHKNKSHPPYQVNRAVAEPLIFAEGIISTVDDEMGGAFSPDGTEFYFSKIGPYTTAPRLGVMCVSRFRDGRWGEPEALPFSGRFLDYPPKFDVTGNRMVFASSRPLPDGTRGAIRIWEVERNGSGWGEPHPLPPPINAAGSSWNADPSLTADGTLYFSSDRGNGAALHIYRARMVQGKYGEPEKLGPEINSEFNDYQPFISPDEKTLVFSSVAAGESPYPHRPEEMTGGGKAYPRGDLYVSYNENGKWRTARHLAHDINTVAEEEFPFFTPDGRYLFFSSERSPFTVPVGRQLDYEQLAKNLHSVLNGHGNVFFVDATALGRDK